MAGLRRDAQDGDDNFGDMEDVASYQIGFLLVELSRSDLPLLRPYSLFACHG